MPLEDRSIDKSGKHSLRSFSECVICLCSFLEAAYTGIRLDAVRRLHCKAGTAPSLRFKDQRSIFEELEEEEKLVEELV